MVENKKEKNKTWDVLYSKQCDENGIITNNVMFVIWNKKDNSVEKQYLILDKSEANLLIGNISESLIKLSEPLESFILEKDYEDWKKGTVLYWFDKPQDLWCIVGEIDDSGNFKKFKKISYRDVCSENIIPNFL